MKLRYTGKTKDVFELPDGNYLLKLKDDATGKDGVFDPGENTVGLTIKGLGRQSLKMSKYYFDIMHKKGIPTHFVDCDLDEVTMTVKPAKIFGKGLEVICRYKATGSFMRRYGAYTSEGHDLDGFVEFTLKDDARLDPPITEDALVMLEIMSAGEYAACKELARKCGRVILEDLSAKGLNLYDIKFEFGIVDGEVALIDEISGGNMRVYRGEQWLQPMELADLVTTNK